MPVVDIKGVGKAQFPDDMSVDDIRTFLQNKYAQETISGKRDLLAPQQQTISPVNLKLSERLGQGVSDILTNTGLISNPYDAQQIGGKISAIGDFLPIIGDATAGDEFGRAAAQGDKFGMVMAGLGAIPLLGDVAKGAVKGTSKLIDDIAEFTKFSDKVTARREAKLSVFGLPTKGKAENIKDLTDLFDYTPEQLVNQMKTLDNVGIRQGGYFKKGEGLDTFYKNDGTSQLIDPKSGKVVFENTAEQTNNLIKDDIINTASSKITPEQRSAEFQARKANDAINNAREAALQESYKMQHTAPMRGDNPSGDDLTSVFDKDIYTGNAQRFFGTGASFDDKAIRIIQSMKGNPNKSVTIYRAVPKSVKEINATDWVTTTKEYAQDHMEGEKGWHILSKKVKAKDIASDGNSIHEFGYDPASQSTVKTKDLLKNKYPDLKIGISENSDNIILDKVIVPEQSKGTGTKFMNDLINDADSKGKPIGLTPSADFGGNKARLTKFYKRFGFVPNKGRNKDFTISESMIRPANG